MTYSFLLIIVHPTREIRLKFLHDLILYLLPNSLNLQNQQIWAVRDKRKCDENWWLLDPNTRHNLDGFVWFVIKVWPWPPANKVTWKHKRCHLHCKYLQPIYSHLLCYISHCNLTGIITAIGCTHDSHWLWGVQFETECYVWL